MYSTPNNFTGLLNSPPFVGDLNETNPLSQYQSSGSTNTPPYANHEETPLDENDEDTPSARGSKKGQRADNFDTTEDKLLVSAWLNNSLDAIKGNEQKKCQFWKRISQYYTKNKTWDKDRSKKSLVSRWVKISATVSRFCGIYSQIEHLWRSGHTEQDKVVEAKEVFRKEEGHPFQLDHCWNILRFQHKWINEHKRIEDKRRSKVYSNKVSKSINLDDDNIEVPDPASLKRPIGRKAAKEANKKAKTIKEVGENDDESSKVRIELEELRARRLENERIRAEQFQLLLATEQKHVELKEKKLELQAKSEEKQAALREKEIEVQDRSEEDRIMAMDTSGMSPIQVEYFERRRNEIFAKQARRFENI